MPIYHNQSFPFRNHSYKVKLFPGIYKFEAWGAMGNSLGGKGSYTTGILSLQKSQNFFIFVGEKGTFESENFNGNKAGHWSRNGGGATDFRLVDSEKWDDFFSLKSRIMVAAGGGGGDEAKGGDGGVLEGFSGEDKQGTSPSPGVGTQENGGNAGKNNPWPPANEGGFGIGGNGTPNDQTSDAGGGGGSGYFGGGGVSGWGGGAGGSSFVSGYPGCNAINDAQSEDLLESTNQPYHYSGFYFNSPSILGGNEEMPSPTLDSMQIGNSDHGYAKITLLSLNTKYCKIFGTKQSHLLIFLLWS